MEHVVIIRYGEIFLKGNNRAFFEKMLVTNLKKSLKGIDYQFSKSQNRNYITNYDPKDEFEILERLKKVFGIFSISPAVKIKSDFELLKEAALAICPKKGKFRVTVKRADNKIKLSSTEIAGNLGHELLKANPELTVDLFRYDFNLKVDMRETGESYLYFQDISGQGGMPVGCSGNGMLLLSGGIDSPVAGFNLAKRGVKLYAVHYHSYPYTSPQAKEKVLELASIVSRYAGEIEVFVVPFTEIQFAIHEKCPAEYMITIMRRFMMRIAEKLAKQFRCGALITGESLGQVASQTMESINVTNSVVEMPVFRPLIGMDKSEIIEIAKRIETFETSILPYEDCCTVFLPKNPVIHPKTEAIVLAEKAIENADELIADALNNVEKIVCSPSGHKTV